MSEEPEPKAMPTRWGNGCCLVLTTLFAGLGLYVFMVFALRP